MATAQKFNADGRGNGFPFCVPRVDVSGMEDWITFAGVSKTSPTTTPALIAQSRRLAFRWYWDAYSITASASIAISGSEDGVQDFSENFSGELLAGSIFFKFDDEVVADSQNPKTEPFEQACGDISGVPFSEGLGSRVLEYNIAVTGVARQIRVVSNFGVYALYNGSVDDDGNFKGFAGALINETPFVPSGSVAIAATANPGGQARSFGGYASTNVVSEGAVISYLELSSGHWLLQALQDDQPVDLDPGSLTASVSLDSLDFWEYA